MSDRKLIEMAAKAVGIDHPGGEHCVNGSGVWDCKKLCWWKPLTDDGDAIRLSKVLFGSVDWIFDEWPDDELGMMQHAVNMPATRRAIVTAAAAIGAKIK